METLCNNFPSKLTFGHDAKRTLLVGAFALGTYQGVKLTGNFLAGVWKHLLRPGYDLKKRYASDSSECWAVVTGAAMGIGKEYAKQLGRRGFNILAIDKDESEMEKTQAELSRLGIKVKTIIWDFGKISNAESYEAFEKELKNATNGLDIGILVNNAAEFQQESLDMISVDRLFRASSVNSLTPALLARYFIPKMLARYNNGLKSAIINVGTNAAEIQNPRYKFAVYGASKAYLHILSSGMREVWGDKIDIMTAIPRQTKTPMCPVDYCFTATPRAHVNAILSQLGHESETYGTMTHDIEYYMRFGMFGGFVIDNMIQWLNEGESKKLISAYERRMS